MDNPAVDEAPPSKNVCLAGMVVWAGMTAASALLACNPGVNDLVHLIGAGSLLVSARATATCFTSAAQACSSEKVWDQWACTRPGRLVGRIYTGKLASLLVEMASAAACVVASAPLQGNASWATLGAATVSCAVISSLRGVLDQVGQAAVDRAPVRRPRPR